MESNVRRFKFSLRVPYAHVDQMGVVYYAHYYVYFEMARSEMLREAGIPYPEMEKRGILLPVVESHCEYRKPARYDDLVEVESWCSRQGPRLHIAYEVKRLKVGTPGVGEAGDVLASGYTEHVCMSPQGRVLRPAPEFDALMATG